MKIFLGITLFLSLSLLAHGQQTSAWGNVQSQHLRAIQLFDSFVKKGVPAPALRRALGFFYQSYGRTLVVKLEPNNQQPLRYRNDKYMVIIDYSKPSTEKRFFLLNLHNGNVESHFVAHGIGTGQGKMAYRFSNIVDSNQTSLGMFITGGMYTGKYGPALKLFGLESSNDRAYERYIVMHGASYVSKEFVQTWGFLGRSHGCPALELDVAKRILPILQKGTLVYAYHQVLADAAVLNPEYQKIEIIDPDDDHPLTEEERL